MISNIYTYRTSSLVACF